MTRAEWDARVVRLAPWCLEVVVTCDGAPWDRAVGVFSKRRDAERTAAALRACMAMQDEKGEG